jgi:hypothetical protein
MELQLAYALDRLHRAAHFLHNAEQDLLAVPGYAKEANQAARVRLLTVALDSDVRKVAASRGDDVIRADDGHSHSTAPCPACGDLDGCHQLAPLTPPPAAEAACEVPSAPDLIPDTFGEGL